jgi:NADPH:quinone reductase-like Zn-dependent oxidoreductase
MKETMKAVVIHEHGDIDQLRYEDHPVPAIRADEVLVEVKAIALNHLDIWVRKGVASSKLVMPHILGSDAAGVVSAVGDLVGNVKAGDRVLLAPGWGCGRCEYCFAGDENLCRDYKVLGENTPGVYAQYARAPGANALIIPDGLTFEEAAAIPLVFLTAWHMLVHQVKIQPGETVLILAAGSGVGSAGIQIAKLYGARVIATASTDAKLQKARELGADDVINYQTHDFLEEVKRLTSKRGVDIVFEHVGKATWDKSIKALRKGGRLVTCGASSGYEAITDLRYVFFKEIKIFGNFMGRRDGLQKALQFFPDRLKPVIDTTFALKDAAKAHARLMNREQFGKVILQP